MKRHIILCAAAAFALSIAAQDFDNNPTVKIDNKEEDLHFTVGARMMMDAAWYHTDFTPMKSGAKLTDARIRTSMAYQNWYFMPTLISPAVSSSRKTSSSSILSTLTRNMVVYTR